MSDSYCKMTNKEEMFCFYLPSLFHTYFNLSKLKRASIADDPSKILKMDEMKRHHERDD